MQQSLTGRYKLSAPVTSMVEGSFHLLAADRAAILSRTHDGRGVLLVDAGDLTSAKALWGKFEPRH
jgi:hypothetical protein